jgi:succinate dehydrogenase flavin-adding protein (antitoxin of CptAB toxin-antitoxin module)
MNYLASDYPVADTKEKKLFNELVKLEDDQLIATILGGKVVDREELRSLVEKIKEHSLIPA